jgi:ATPase subunit of ABC transporter with duplicated ATPase domains
MSGSMHGPLFVGATVVVLPRWDRDAAAQLIQRYRVTIWQAISGGTDVMMVGKREINTRAYVGSFNFKGGDQQKKVGQLSGGERNRVHLAKTLTTGGNDILHDEPTNDLDIETLELLEDLLQDYTGTLFLVSHDRAFLDNVVTQTIAYEGEGVWKEYAGGYNDWSRASRKAVKAAVAAAAPPKWPIGWRPMEHGNRLGIICKFNLRQ